MTAAVPAIRRQERSGVNDCPCCWACVLTCWMPFCPICLENMISFFLFRISDHLSSTPLLFVCAFVVPCFIFIFRTISCLERAGVSEALHHLVPSPRGLFCPRGIFLSMLSHQTEDFFWKLPSIPFLPHLLCCSFPGCRGSVFKLAATVRTDIYSCLEIATTRQ